MKYLKQLMIILAALLAGMSLEYLLKIPVPGVVLGLIILFLALATGLIKKEMIEEVSEFLLSHLAFFFIPAGVGLMATADILKGNLLPFAVIILVTTAVVWFVTAFTVKFLRKILE